MHVAIVHDWFVVYAGAERVVEQLLEVYPQADLFGLVDFLPPGERGFIGDRPIKTSFLQRMPWARTHYREYLPLFPLAIEQLDLRGYDLVITSSYAVAKGVITSPEQLHVCYCHSPIRYAWDMREEYLEERNIANGLRSILPRILLHRLRKWDALTADGPDHYISNSEFIRARIQKFYRRQATVIAPPVDVHRFRPLAEKEEFYLTVSRAVPYKRIPLIVKAFREMPTRRLVVIGDGPEGAKVRSEAEGAANIDVLGFQPNDVVESHMRRARAFVFAAMEDFGIVPLEAQACGTPVIALGAGGSLETVRGLGHANKPTGVFFDTHTPEAIIDAVDRFEQNAEMFSADQCREHAVRFSPERFRREIASHINAWLGEHRAGRKTNPLDEQWLVNA
ncbi:MAG: glycosyltransferase family 4 protein [Rhodospirillales bacterium]